MRWVTFLLAAILCGLAGAAGAGDADALRAAGRLTEAAATASAPPLDPADAAWRKAPSARLVLYPQAAVPPRLEGVPAKTVEVRVLATGERLALRLEWEDAGEDRWRTDRTDAFADAAAVQFALGRDGLPYVGMGEPGRPVRLWTWRAGRPAELLAAEGFGSLRPAAGKAPQARAVRTVSGWAVVLSGRLPKEAANPLPLAVAVWDGADGGRDGRKWLGAWHLFALPGRPTDGNRLARLAVEAATVGDVARGRLLFSGHGCPLCHLPAEEGPSLLAPSLAFAGGVHWPGYLRRSIVAPSAFVVPRPEYAQPAPSGVASVMPLLELAERDVDDLVAYLATFR